ncbi:sugar phosphate isomerase/epimerase [Nonomuraea sp. B12E4]|uniref:sugar phosphate isomerase/epimerase family protein n=1 Tax=Nonomuraea sp. B12E4 TaxID=3153564 RepID=UPI00325C944D
MSGQIIGSGSLSLNQWTTRRWSVAEAVDGCVRHGLAAVGLWREKVAEQGLAESVKLVRAAGLRVSSLCRGGFLTAGGLPGEEGRRAFARALDDNRRAVDEAAELGAACLVMVVGGLPGVKPGEPLPTSGQATAAAAAEPGGLADGTGPGGAAGEPESAGSAGFSRDLAGARERVAEAVAELAPYAGERGVKLALEPLHPIYCPDRAVLSTLGQALELSLPYPEEQVGVVVDTFHVWWDPRLFEDIARAGRRIASYQVCDYLHPLPEDVLLGRGMMGDGVIDFAPITRAVMAAGYTGDVEVEIFNADVWTAEPDEVVATMKTRYEDVMLPTR